MAFRIQTWVLALLSSVALVTGLSIPSAKGVVTGLKRSVSESFTVLSTADIARLKQFTFYASAAYCRPSQIIAWECGRQFYLCPWRLTNFGLKFPQKTASPTLLSVPWHLGVTAHLSNTGMLVLTRKSRWGPLFNSFAPKLTSF